MVRVASTCDTLSRYPFRCRNSPAERSAALLLPSMKLAELQADLGSINLASTPHYNPFHIQPILAAACEHFVYHQRGGRTKSQFYSRRDLLHGRITHRRLFERERAQGEVHRDAVRCVQQEYAMFQRRCSQNP